MHYREEKACFWAAMSLEEYLPGEDLLGSMLILITIALRIITHGIYSKYIKDHMPSLSVFHGSASLT